MNKNILLLIGSPRKKNSTSYSIGIHLLNVLKANQCSTTELFIYDVIRKDDVKSLIEEVNHADIILLAAPLYVDSEPAYVIKAMDWLFENKNDLEQKPRHLLTIVNCGFPESHQNLPAIDIYRYFSRKMGFSEFTGIPVGMGPAIDGKDLGSLGAMVRNIVKGLNLIAKSLLEDKPVSEEAIHLISKKIIPAWLYKFLGNRGWNKLARLNNLTPKDFRKQLNPDF